MTADTGLRGFVFLSLFSFTLNASVCLRVEKQSAFSDETVKALIYGQSSDGEYLSEGGDPQDNVPLSEDETPEQDSVPGAGEFGAPSFSKSSSDEWEAPETEEETGAADESGGEPEETAGEPEKTAPQESKPVLPAKKYSAKPSEEIVRAEYSFKNFNRDALRINFSMPKKEFAEYEAGYGYCEKELTRLKNWHEKTRQAAYKAAVKNNYSQARLDKTVGAIDADYKKQLRGYLENRKFCLKKGNVIEVNMPKVIKHSIPYLKAAAAAFDKIAAQNRYGTQDTIGAVTSLVQTAIRYRQPSETAGSKHTGGILSPVNSMLSGWGDCDTKTGLLASILGNWSGMKIVGVAVPGHYLMGVRLSPGKGDLFIEHGGTQYVLIEPAGPAWLPPGTVGRETIPLLESAEGYRIDPI